MRSLGTFLVSLRVAAAALVLAGAACQDHTLPPPDPTGNDLVKGAVVAATEASGGIRLYKIVHVDEYPPPLGVELHMIAYEPKAKTFEDASKLWRKEKERLKVALDYMAVMR